MALDTYLGLIAAVGDFRTRADATTARVDYFIDLTESWLNQKLRSKEMETTNGALTVSNGLISHPADWLEWKDLGYTSGGKRYSLKPASQEQAGDLSDGETDAPLRYTVRSGSTLLTPRPDATYTYDGTYYQKVPAIGSAQTTNWVLTNYADVYLYGTLYASSIMLPDARGPMWKGLFDAAVQTVNAEPTKGSVLRMTSASPVY